MKRINNCTLICADTYNYGGAVASLKKCMAQCEFDRVVFFTNIPLKLEGIEVIQIEDLKGKDGYSHFMLKELHKYIESEFLLTVQHDSWILDGEQFDERLYKVDWAGALWLESDGLANGNGGFSWRSKRLMDAVAVDDLINATSPEDVCVCRVYRRYLEKNYNLVWASDEICEQFSFELRTPAQPTFGFHSFFHKSYQKTVVVIRKAALGDVVQVEKVLQYFFDKGYRVVLDTLPQFHLLFINHYFKVHKLEDVDQRLIKNAKIVNLDGVYEAEPDMNHLDAYFKYTGEPYEEYKSYLKRPQLNLGFSLNQETKLFKKQVVIHYDIRWQNGRNVFGIDWDEIAACLISKGYIVLQVGKGEHPKIKGVHEINITNENFLCYVIGSADLFIGCDSGPSNIAVGFGVPSIIFFGMVDSKVVHKDLSKVYVIENEPCCSLWKCWHKSGIGATAGMKCIVDESKPPCVQFETKQVISAIDKIMRHERFTEMKIIDKWLEA